MRSFSRISGCIAFFIILVCNVEANVSLPEIFSDNMVLQRNSEVVLWGWAKAGEPVSVKAGWLNEPVSFNTSPGRTLQLQTFSTVPVFLLQAS